MYLNVYRYIYIYTYIYAYMYTHTQICTCIDRKKPPPRGGFSIYYVPWSRAMCKRFNDEMRPSHHVVKSLTHGSWSGNIVNRNTVVGSGLFRSVYVLICVCVYMYAYIYSYIYIHIYIFQYMFYMHILIYT